MLLPNIHILGVQGSGKGTQTGLLVKKYSLTSLPTGNLFRRRALIADDFGRELAALLRTGDLLPDEYLIRIVEDFFESTSITHGLLGDGAIRTAAQYELLDTIWKRNNFDEPYLIHLELSDDIALQRIKSRGVQDDIPREDTSPEAISRRLALFHEKTEPVIDEFKAAGRITPIDASAPVEEVFAQICDTLETIFPKLAV